MSEPSLAQASRSCTIYNMKQIDKQLQKLRKELELGEQSKMIKDFDPKKHLAPLKERVSK